MTRPRSGHSGAPSLLGQLARAGQCSHSSRAFTRNRFGTQRRAPPQSGVTSFTDGMCAMNSRSGRKTRLMAAVVGGGAVMAVGALSASLTPMSGANEADSDIVNVGSTTTATTPPAAPSIAVAVPAIRGPAPLFAGEAPDANPQ